MVKGVKQVLKTINAAKERAPSPYREVFKALRTWLFAFQLEDLKYRPSVKVVENGDVQREEWLLGEDIEIQYECGCEEYDDVCVPVIGGKCAISGDVKIVSNTEMNDEGERVIKEIVMIEVIVDLEQIKLRCRVTNSDATCIAENVCYGEHYELWRLK